MRYSGMSKTHWKRENKNSKLRQLAAFVSEHTIKCLLAFYDFFSPQGIFFSFSSDNYTQKQTDNNGRNDVQDNIAKNDDHVVMMMMMMMMMIVVTIGYEATSVQNMQWLWNAWTNHKSTMFAFFFQNIYCSSVLPGSMALYEMLSLSLELKTVDTVCKKADLPLENKVTEPLAQGPYLPIKGLEEPSPSRITR